MIYSVVKIQVKGFRFHISELTPSLIWTKGVKMHEHAFVVALEMNPMQIKIADVIARSSDSAPKKKSKNKGVMPKISFVEDGNIYILCRFWKPRPIP